MSAEAQQTQQEAQAAQAEATSKKKGAEVEQVEMTDGRKVDFAGKRQLIKDVTVDEAAKTVSVRFDFRNGETRTFTVPESLILRMAGHGASQKIGDETAGVKDIDDMVVAVDDIIARLEKGEWGAERKAGDGFAGSGIVIKAMVEVTKKSVDDIKAWIDAKCEALKCTKQALYASLRNPNSEIGKVIARMELEKKQKEAKYNADDLMSELTGGNTAGGDQAASQ